jgi:hypothetical protein
MVLREVDAARCSLADLAVVGMDVAAVRGVLRPGAVLVVSDDHGGAVATGPFGEVAFVPSQGSQSRAAGRMHGGHLSRDGTPRRAGRESERTMVPSAAARSRGRTRTGGSRHGTLSG